MPEPIADMWWLRPGGGSDQTIGSQWLQGMALGAKMRQENIQNDLAQQQLEVMRGAHALDLQKAQATLDAMQAKQLTDATRAKGMALMGQHLAKVAATGGWGDPKNEAAYWQLGADYAHVFDSDFMDKTYQNTYAKHHDWQVKADELKAEQEFAKNADLSEIVQVGPNKFQQRHGETIVESTTDPATGKVTSRVIMGAKAGSLKDANAPTTAMQTRLQEGLLSADKALQEGSKIYKTLTEGAVGVAGQVNKFKNEWLAQVNPKLGNPDVIEPQTWLGAYREKVIQAMTAGGDKRISDKDRKYWDEVLPKVSAGESLQSAQKKIATIQNFIRNEARANAKAAGKDLLTVPYLMTPGEILDAVQAGNMTEAQATKLANDYGITR